MTSQPLSLYSPKSSSPSNSQCLLIYNSSPNSSPSRARTGSFPFGRSSIILDGSSDSIEESDFKIKEGIQFLKNLSDIFFQNIDQIEEPLLKKSLNEKIKKIQLDLNDCIIPAKKKENLCTRLTEFKDYIKELKWITSDNLPLAIINFNKNIKTYDSLYKETIEKIDRLARKIKNEQKYSNLLLSDDTQTSQIIQAAMHAIGKVTSKQLVADTLSNFCEKVKINQTKCKELKSAFSDFIIPYKEYEDMVLKDLYSGQISSVIARLFEKLKPLNKALTNLKRLITSISPDTLSFVKSPTQAKETQYKNNFFSYLFEKKYFFEKKEIMSLDGKMNKKLKVVKTTLKDITDRIEKIKSRYDEITKLFDEKTTKKFDQQIESSIKLFETLHEDILNYWNIFCLNLYDFHHQKLMFERFEPAFNKMGHIYITAESLLNKIRGMLDIKNRNEAKETYKLLMKDYKQLCELIIGFNDKTEIKTKKLYNSFDEKINDLSVGDLVYEVPDGDLLKANLEQNIKEAICLNHTFTAIYPLKEDASIEQISEKIGCISTSETKKSTITEVCTKKKLAFYNDMQAEKERIIKCKDLLKKICSEVADGMSKIGKTLETTKGVPLFLNNFNEALNNNAIVVWNGSKSIPEDEIAPYPKIFSPFHSDFNWDQLSNNKDIMF